MTPFPNDPGRHLPGAARMNIRTSFPVMLGEYWVYALAIVNSAVILALLYTLKAPIRFGIW
jgi:hypothetical protein